MPHHLLGAKPIYILEADEVLQGYFAVLTELPRGQNPIKTQLCKQ
ncbi:hypothetical protein TCCBUS3UF1_19240 [Thermus sp. CCB_US3_UF1]|nr:hypothetical protein TCCBUS3UF1_19240 [Thermus sp. CCB_US3_UF1]